MNTNLDQGTICGRYGQAARLNEARRCVSMTAVRREGESTRTGLRWYDRVAALPRKSLPAAHRVQRQVTRAPLPSLHECNGVVPKTWQFRICDWLGASAPCPCYSVAAVTGTPPNTQEIS